MTRLLTPSEVHFFAAQVYQLDQAFRKDRLQNPKVSIESINQDLAHDSKDKLTNPQFGNFSDFTVLSSSSGIFNLELMSGFGFIAQGTGPRTGEWILATRGTNARDNKYDIATDANIAVQTGPRGHPVHAGFNTTFKGYENQLIRYLVAQGVKRPTVIHCIGHSLGGALANLNAALLKMRGYNVALYTLGSPRVGYLSFAHDMTKCIPEIQIKRIMNPADPVAMVPLFPFVHASRSASELYVPVAHSGTIRPENHFLDDGYKPVASMSSWAHLKTAAQYDFDRSLMKKCLKDYGSKSNMSMMAMLIVDQKLADLGKAAAWSPVVAVQSVLSGSLSVFDQLQSVMSKVPHLTGKPLQAYNEVIHSMSQFLGRAKPAPNQSKADVALLKGLLGHFNTEVGGMASLAIRKASAA